jgi:TetR/AcrR family transcriptional repressor of nem operon
VRGTIALLSSRMAATLKPRQREDKALAAAASMVGALVLARAVDDPKLSDDILRATRKSLVE